MNHAEVEGSKSLGAEARSRWVARWGGRLFPLAAALGVGFGLFVSLWVGAWEIERSVVVYAESVAVRGAPYPVRVESQDAHGEAVAIERVELSYEPDEGPVVRLGELSPLGAGFRGIHGATLRFPGAGEGEGTLVVRVHQAGHETTRWTIPVAVRGSRRARAPARLNNESKLALIDDSDPQPDALKIDVEVMGQMLAPFTNVFMVRLTDADGRPLRRAVKVSLASGMFGALQGSHDAPPVVFEGSTDGDGLARFKGRVQTEVIRLKVDVAGAQEEGVDVSTVAGDGSAGATMDSAGDPVTRVVRLVGYPGAVKLTVAQPTVVTVGATVELRLAQIGARGSLIDVHDATGAWIDTLTHTEGSDLVHRWTVSPGTPAGLVSLEAYRRSSSFRAGAMVELLFVGGAGASRAARERALLHKVREATSSSSSAEEDTARQLRWLSALEETATTPGRGGLRLEWLMGTMDRAAYGAPVALRSLPLDTDALRARKHEIHGYVRSYLVVGGILYVLLFAGWLLLESRLQRVGLTGEEAGVLRDAAPSKAEGAARFALMILMVGGTLALIIALFDNLIWSYH